MTPSYLLFSCLLAAAYVDFGECTKCYTCTTANDKGCEDPMMPDETKAFQCTSDVMKQAADVFNTASKTLSEMGASLGINMQAKPVDANLQCSKIDIISEAGLKQTIRGCSMPPTENFDPCKTITEKYASGNVKVSFCGTCNTDYCNGATSLKITAAFMLPLLAVLLSNFN